MEPNPQQENPAEQTVQTEGQPEKAPEPVTPEAGATAGTEGTAGTEETGAAAGTETAEEAPVQPVEEEEEKPLGRADRSLMFFFWPLVVTALYVPVGLICSRACSKRNST